MARKSDIEYIRYYTDGSAARKMEPALQPQRRQVSRPKRRSVQVKRVEVDPVAVTSIAVAAVLLIMMLVGFAQLNEAMAQKVRMEKYVQQLQQENRILEENYRSGYDLEEIERTALALGMVPKDSLQRITIEVEPVVISQEPTFWQRVYAFFTGLLA